VWPEHRALQQPEWPDPESARDYFDQLRGLPPLVGADECEALTSELALAGTGAAFVLHLGDCVETFADCRTEALSARQALAAAAAAVLSYGTGRRVVTIGRIAGQYAKPRSQPVESETGLPTYRGDIVNSADPDPAARIPDPQRMLSGYFHAAATMNYLRAHPVPPAGPAVALLRRAADAGADLSAAALLGNVADIFEAAASAPVDCRQVHSLVPRLWVSHEALLLPYEHALTRYGHEGQWWDTSAHLLWIGDRTRDQRHPHIQLAERIGNPVAVKIGPTAEPEELAALCRRINPDKTPGRLTLIVRMGAHRAAPALPPLMAAAAATGIPVGWVCDPMHGNTHTAADGHKTRSLDDIAEEIRAFFEACRHTGTIPGGLHLETAPEDVTECVGGWGHLGEDDLSRNYRTRCDPRLNAVQTLQCVTLAVRELQSFPDPLS
jgi:3-deoxy-D-arabino-heptulosonate 7-phosphate (DAHP) synthase class II